MLLSIKKLYIFMDQSFLYYLLSSNINSKPVSRWFGTKFFLEEGQFLAGGKTMSTLSWNASSTIFGIILSSTKHDVYRQGFVFTSMSQGLNYSSIIKSKPKI
jgi:hypothetical protein